MGLGVWDVFFDTEFHKVWHRVPLSRFWSRYARSNSYFVELCAKLCETLCQENVATSTGLT